MKTAFFSASVLVLAASIAQANPPASTPKLIEKGKAAFAVNCVVCHGEKGDGTGVAAAALDPKPRNFSTASFKNGNKPAQVFGAISNGLPNTAMVGFGHLPEEERWGLAYYVLTFVPSGKAAPAKKK